MERRYYRISEAAAALACSRTTIYELVKAGELMKCPTPYGPRIPVESVDAFADRMEGKTKAKKAEEERLLRLAGKLADRLIP